MYEIKVNLIKEDLSRARKNNTKTKTNPEKLFNRLEFIKNIKK